MIKKIEYRNKSIFYKVEGDGPSIVFLHGFMENLHIWDRHSEELSKEYQVISIDLPGHGQSDTWSDNHGMMFSAESVHTVLQAEQVEKCIMIGHSMGGYITLAFAEKYPSKLNGFGLFHSHPMSDNDKAKKNRERTIEIIKADKGGFINQFIPSLYADENRERFKIQIDEQIELANSMNPKGVIAAINGMKERNMRLDVVAFAEVPILFILGKHDDRIPLNQALAQAAAAQLSEIIILGKSGHMGWLEETEHTIAAIHGFIRLCLK